MKEEKETKLPKEESKIDSTTKVPLSEEFQREVISLTEKASKDECDFICDKAYERQEELRKEEREEQDEPTMDDYKGAMAGED